MELIDKSAVVAEIEKVMNEQQEICKNDVANGKEPNPKNVEVIYQFQQLIKVLNKLERLKTVNEDADNNQNWKPSKGQINALEHFVKSIAESGYASPYDDNTKLLKSLINDLYKLETFPILSNSSKTVKKWTEEDSLMIDSVIDTIKWLKGKGATDMKIEWLKSLKQRLEQ